MLELQAAGGSLNSSAGDTFFGRTPLHFAAANNNSGAADALVAAGADVTAVDSRRRTPLHWAARSGCLALVDLLLARGARVVADESGYTPLYWAVDAQDLATVQSLLGAGAKVDARSHIGEMDSEQELPDTALKRAILHGNVEIVRALLAAGADANVCTDWGEPPLIEAAACEYTSMLRTLLDAGAGESLQQVSEDGETALVRAVQHGHDKCMAALLAAGAAVQGPGEGSLALSEAAARCHASVVARLLAVGASCLPAKLEGIECALLRVWRTAPACLPVLAAHMHPDALARVRTALIALRFHTPLAKPELYMRVLGLRFGPSGADARSPQQLSDSE